MGERDGGRVTNRRRRHGSFPLWLKAGATAFLGVFFYTSWNSFGFLNYLWFSCIGLIGTVVALWLESRLLTSMMLLATFVADEVGWGGDFVVALVTGWHPFGATKYMFDDNVSLVSRGVSLFHFIVPILLVWMVLRLGYDGRALAAQTVCCWIILLLSYAVTDPVHNVNCVYGLGTSPQAYVPGWLYLAGVMAYVPLGFYVPVHLVLRRLGWDGNVRTEPPASLD